VKIKEDKKKKKKEIKDIKSGVVAHMYCPRIERHVETILTPLQKTPHTPSKWLGHFLLDK
jgi:hypothetical protein